METCLKCGAIAVNDTPVCQAHGAYTDYEEKPICENCGQWQHKYKGRYDCLNDCVSRGFAQEPQEITGGQNG